MALLLLTYVRHPPVGSVPIEQEDDSDDLNGLDDLINGYNLDTEGEGVSVIVPGVKNEGLKAQEREYALVCCSALESEGVPADGSDGLDTVVTIGLDPSLTEADISQCDGHKVLTGITLTCQAVCLSVLASFPSSTFGGTFLPAEITNCIYGVKKEILVDINATLRPGRLTALMGGSGSGKTSLLNLMAGRLHLTRQGDKAPPTLFSRLTGSTSNYFSSGYVLFNGVESSVSEKQQQIGYVQQYDFHLPSLSVLETLTFHSHLRLPRNFNARQKGARVDSVIALLGLQRCQHTRVGDDTMKGISGGEKRRLSLGVAMLLDPPICLLDEPTTGLDAFTARGIVDNLANLAHTGNRTIIMSIHQPRYDIFGMLDDIILLSRGRQVWCGAPDTLLRHLSGLGYDCPSLVNPVLKLFLF